MSKEEIKIVPRLRFPEFEDDGNWVEKSLGECLLKHPEYGIGAAAVPYSISLPTYLRITDISEDGSFLKSQKVSVAMEVTTENYLDDGDIVLARTGASVGKSYKYRIADGKLVFAGFLIRVKPNTNKLNSEFIYQYLSTERYWRWVDFTSTRSGQPGMNSKEYALLPVPLPPLINEQQKIAECLSSLDDLLTAENQKLEALNAHKKGLMQQLFPAEGETVPKRRFAEFRDSGEWEEKTLKSACRMQAGKFVSASDISESKSNDLFPCYGGNGLRGYTKTYTHSGMYPLVGRQGALCGNVMLAQGKFHATEHAVVCTPKEGVDTVWLYYLLKYLNLNQYATGQAQPGLSVDNLEQVDIKIPESKEEQQKIAICLSSSDELITAQVQKIEAIKQHKKGLMQGLFPMPETTVEL